MEFYLDYGLERPYLSDTGEESACSLLGLLEDIVHHVYMTALLRKGSWKGCSSVIQVASAHSFKSPGRQSICQETELSESV